MQKLEGRGTLSLQSSAPVHGDIENPKRTIFRTQFLGDRESKLPEPSVLQNQTPIGANWEFEKLRRDKGGNGIVRVVSAVVE